MTQLVVRSLLIPEARGSKPVIGKIYIEHSFRYLFTISCSQKTKINKKRPRGALVFFKKTIVNYVRPSKILSWQKGFWGRWGGDRTQQRRNIKKKAAYIQFHMRTVMMVFYKSRQTGSVTRWQICFSIHLPFYNNKNFSNSMAKILPMFIPNFAK